MPICLTQVVLAVSTLLCSSEEQIKTNAAAHPQCLPVGAAPATCSDAALYFLGGQNLDAPFIKRWPHSSGSPYLKSEWFQVFGCCICLRDVVAEKMTQFTFLLGFLSFSVLSCRGFRWDLSIIQAPRCLSAHQYCELGECYRREIEARKTGKGWGLTEMLVTVQYRCTRSL